MVARASMHAHNPARHYCVKLTGAAAPDARCAWAARNMDLRSDMDGGPGLGQNKFGSLRHCVTEIGHVILTRAGRLSHWVWAKCRRAGGRAGGV